MKNIILTSISLFLGFATLHSLSAAESLEHFVTKDGRHFCSVFMKNDFKSCEDFGIKYDGEKVVAGEKPFFAAGYPTIAKIMVGTENFCVEGSPTDMGREVDMEKCSNSSGSTMPENETISLETIDSSTGALNEDASGSIVEFSGSSSLSQTGSSDTASTGANLQETSLSGEIPPIETVESSAKCSVNGKEVDCAQMMAGAKSIVKTGFGILGIIMVLSFIFGIFWLWMLIHALMNQIPNKTLWVLVIFFLYPIGAIAYYFVVKKGFVTVPVVSEPSTIIMSGNMQPMNPAVPTATLVTPEMMSPVAPTIENLPYVAIPSTSPIVTSVPPLVTPSPVITIPVSAPIPEAMPPVSVEVAPQVMAPIQNIAPMPNPVPPPVQNIPTIPVVNAVPPQMPNQGQNIQ